MMGMNYCRLCAEIKQNTELINILDDNTSNSNLNFDYKLYQCFGIVIDTDDILPKVICKNCFYQSIQSYMFYKKVIRAQNTLQNIFHNQINRASDDSTQIKIEIDQNVASTSSTVDTTNDCDNDFGFIDIKEEPSNDSDFASTFENTNYLTPSKTNDISTNTTNTTSSGDDYRTSITDGKFFALVEEKCIKDIAVAKCVKCLVEIRGRKKSSSNFLCHLKRKHGDEAVDEYKKYLIEKNMNRYKIPKTQSNIADNNRIEDESHEEKSQMDNDNVTIATSDSLHDNASNVLNTDNATVTTAISTNLIDEYKVTITDGKFFSLIENKCIMDIAVAKCVRCSAEVRGRKKSSSNFLCHLKRRHGDESVEEYKNYLFEKKVKKPKLT